MFKGVFEGLGVLGGFRGVGCFRGFLRGWVF